MTTLRPTPSRGRVRGLPLRIVVPVAVVLGAALVGGGLLLTSGGEDEAPPVAAPTACTFTAKPPTGPITVNVYNATDRDGLAGRTADDLEMRAFTLGEVANDPDGETVEGTAIVRHPADAADQARWVAAQVPKAKLVEIEGDDETSGDHASASATPDATASVASTVTVSLVLGDDFEDLASSKGARAAYERTAKAAACPSAPAS